MNIDIQKAMADWERKHNLYTVNRCYGAKYQRHVTPEEIMELCNAVARTAQEQLNEMAKLLPDCFYMDPPDGGAVSLQEQFQRMANDARLFRAAPVSHIGDLLSDAMDRAVDNGANSISMPDEYVGIAAWLCDVVHGPEYEKWLSQQNKSNLRIEKHLDGILLTCGKPMYGGNDAE